ncbi:MAG: beta-N-acetylhexosaminidase [Verrucomicrobiota bacterium]
MIIPQPSSIKSLEGRWTKTHKGHFPGDCRIAISAPHGLDAQADLLAGYLAQDQMFRSERAMLEGSDIELDLSLLPRALPNKLEGAGFRDEHYRLCIRTDKILLSAASPDGIAMGIQTLRQLLSGQRARLALPCMLIDDRPAMAWRGLHLDVSRHFWDAETVRRFIDLAAFHKFNLFHWHLTDDQGWRLPIEGYPKLTEVAAWRNGTLVGHECDRNKNSSDGIRHGGFYTHDEIREIVSYAAARGVHVLPEVDVPGHVQSLVTAYPEFGNAAEAPGVRQCWGISDSTLNLEHATFVFLEKAVATLAELFPFAYVHFGGDEARTVEWAASTRIQERKRELGLESDHDVQGHFTAQLVALLRTHGRKLIGWDEIIEHDLPDPEAAVMYWRDNENPDHGLDRKALENGHGLVLASWSRTYFDHYQAVGPGNDSEPLAIGGNLPLETVYEWDPLARIPEHLRTGVFGAQAQVWTEYIATRNHLDYMVFPRACALAQVLWTGKSREPLADFSARLSSHLPRLDRLGVTYRPPLPSP